jgi:hypothetical protein
MTVVQELFETYDPLEKAPTLTLYQEIGFKTPSF